MAEDQTNPETIEPTGTTVELPEPVSGVTVGMEVTASGDVTVTAEHTPTPEEAREMFAENPGLWAVLTTEGNKLRGEC